MTARIDLSYPARQARLDAIRDSVRTPRYGGHTRYGVAIDFASPTDKEEPSNMTINREWRPDYLVRAYFNQNSEWITAAGDRIAVADMPLDHVANALLMLERVADDLPFPRETLQSTPLYKALYDRLMTGGRTAQPSADALIGRRIVDWEGDVATIRESTSDGELRIEYDNKAFGTNGFTIINPNEVGGEDAAADLFDASKPNYRLLSSEFTTDAFGAIRRQVAITSNDIRSLINSSLDNETGRGPLPVFIDYEAATGERSTGRLILPYRIEMRQAGCWPYEYYEIVFAKDLAKDALRTFRLDRILRAERENRLS